MQQNLPTDEQAPIAFTAAQDLIWPCVILDSSFADTSARHAPEHDLQQYLPNDEQAPPALTTVQDVILPADSLDTWLADASTQEKPDPEPLLALPEELPLPLLEP